MFEVISYPTLLSVSTWSLNHISKLSSYTNTIGYMSERIEKLSGQENIFTGSTGYV